ncbi:MAG: hypothetical protein ACI9GW_003386 [Halieaceae bacterium]|jgi:hypothetical protein
MANRAESLPVNPRLAQSAHSPKWLASIGKLTIPTRKWQNREFQHSNEHCSASLIAPQAARVSTRIVTAWHCLEYYSDLSRPISFLLTRLNGVELTREARIFIDGGDMDRDWAVLSLSKPISLDGMSVLSHSASGLSLLAEPDAAITVAGYSGDSGLGQNGDRLTYQENCQSGARTKNSISVNCVAHKGASGGPAVVTVQEEESLVHYLAGIISQGNGVDTSILIGGDSFSRAILQAWN